MTVEHVWITVHMFHYRKDKFVNKFLGVCGLSFDASSQCFFP
jgi:hypothetical protein